MENQTEYFPDKWIIVKAVLPSETFYRVFASWSGGYTHGDSWKMNSGITSVRDSGEHWCFYGYSGSVYYCRKPAYGVTAYSAGILEYIRTQWKDKCDLTVMPEDTDWMNMEWSKDVST